MRTILIVIVIFLVCQLIICLYAKENYNMQQITGHFGGVPSQANINPCQTVGYGYSPKGCTSFDNELPDEDEEVKEKFGDGYGKKCPHCHPNEQPYMELENMQGDDLINFFPVNNWPPNDSPCASCSCNKNL